MSKPVNKKLLIKKNEIVRPRLLDIVHANADKRAICVCAPAGFGKSVLVRQWLEQKKVPSAWLRMDSSLDSFSLFIEQLTRSIRKIYPIALKEVGLQSRFIDNTTAELVSRQIINELEELQRPLRIVIDDYHEVNDPEIHLFIKSILFKYKEYLTLVIITRNEPPIGLSRLRLYDELLEVGIKELKFTENEQAQLLNQLYDKTAIDDVKDQLEKADGWILGIRLIMTAKLIQPNKASKISKELEIDYLIHGVSESLSSSMLTALEVSSILESFNPDMLTVLFEEVERIHLTGDEFISELIRNNLFILPDENQDGWYRFHALFRQMLQSHFERSPTVNYDQLYTVSSGWLVKEGLIDLAIKYAINVDNLDLAVDHINQNRMAAFDQDRWWEVERWIQHFPRHVIKHEPTLLLSLVWICEYTWQLEEIPKLLIQLDYLNPDSFTSKYQSEYHLHLGHHYHHYVNDHEQALKHLELSKQLYENTGMFGARREMFYGMTLQVIGDTKKALENLITISKNNDSKSPMNLRSLLTIVIIHLLNSKFNKAEWYSMQLYKDSHGGSFRTVRAWSLYLEGNIAFQLCKVDAAESLTAALNFEDAMNRRVYFDTLAGIAISYALDGQDVAALNTIDKLKNSINYNNSSFIRVLYHSLEKRINLILGYHDTIRQMPITFPENQLLHFYFLIEVPELTQIRVLLCLGGALEIEKGLEKVHYLRKMLESRHNSYHDLDILLLLAIGYYRSGKQNTGMDYLHKAAKEYSQSEHIRPYIEILAILPEFIHWAPNEVLPVSILSAKRSPTVKSIKMKPLAFFDGFTLTKREMQVALLVTEGHANKEIAKKLSIRETTVKAHLTNIFKKTKARNRTSLTHLFRDE